MLGESWKFYTWYDCRADDFHTMEEKVEISFNISTILRSFLEKNDITSPYYSIPINELVRFTRKHPKLIIVMESQTTGYTDTFQNGHHNMFVDSGVAINYYKLNTTDIKLLIVNF